MILLSIVISTIKKIIYLVSFFLLGKSEKAFVIALGREVEVKEDDVVVGKSWAWKLFLRILRERG
jgi:hypothetical protein